MERGGPRRPTRATKPTTRFKRERVVLSIPNSFVWFSLDRGSVGDYRGITPRSSPSTLAHDPILKGTRGVTYPSAVNRVRVLPPEDDTLECEDWRDSE